MDYSKFRPESFEYRGKWVHNWFSNMEPFKFEVDGILYNSIENFYQAYKTTDLKLRKVIASQSPQESKKTGRSLIIRPDWESIKFTVMNKALLHKFTTKEWAIKLLETGSEPIIEWNNWNDKIWGVSIKDNEGQNNLGSSLELIRTYLKKSKIWDINYTLNI